MLPYRRGCARAHAADGGAGALLLTEVVIEVEGKLSVDDDILKVIISKQIKV